MTPSVLHVSQATTAGVGRFLELAVRAHAGHGWQVAVASPPDPRLAEHCRRAGGEHHVWHATRAPGLGSLRESRALRRVIASVDPDLVFLHASKAGFVGRLVLRGRRPTVFCPHAWSFLDGGRAQRAAARLWERSAARWATIVLCVSAAEQQRGRRAGVRARTRTIPNAVDLERFHPATALERASLRADMGLEDGATAVCVGRVCRQKGQDVLLAAWPRVLDLAPAAELVIVGDGPDRAALEALALPHVRFVGDQTDVRRWMVAADVVVQPSRWEGGSYVTLEALACGRPVVVSDVDGAREAVGDAPAAGAVVAPGDPIALAAALGGRLADPAWREAEGITALERSRQFGLGPWEQQLMALSVEVARPGRRS